MKTSVIENISAWLVFIVALTTYCLTMEPTNSWWDCGEYIATAYKLQVGHPPGAPLFLLIANLFSQLALGDTSKVALMVNFMSALCSAGTIIFLFWTIQRIAKKITNKQENAIATLSAAIGSLVYTFSDSFWFSAVEGEVYAMSSLFTAVVFWAIIRWESEVDTNQKANKWLVFIAYLIGLSIGVHMLSLLVIPAIVLIYYFKNYSFNFKGFILANICAVILLGLIYNLIIPQFVNLAGKFEIFFINNLSLPFNSGTIFFFLITIGGIVYSLILSFRHKYFNLNTSILAFTFLLLGYMSFFTLVIRSNANTPIDENSPEDAVSLLSYLNREQYGTTPLLYGQYYNTEVINYKDGNPVYVKDIKKGKYVVSDDRKQSVPLYDDEKSGIFPRMWSRDERHISAYQEWAGINNIKQKPKFTENLKFFLLYQINHMYFRYFMWNFAGKQNDKQGHGELNNGNWLSGINFIDDTRLGPQKSLPDHLEKNAGRNKFYFLPLILGLIGLFFHYQKNPKDTWAVFLLFFFTGLAIVVELNQTPFQPRERDYAYVGSFYAFTIWIGLGTIQVYYFLKKLVSNKTISLLVSVTLLFIPTLMAAEGWDDHDRSNRYTAREFAKNYLKSCEPNAILFTMGDNDTFPLWYIQEVEGYRTDVRIVNLSLLNTDWYIDQMKRDAYDGKGLPFSLNRNQYKQGTRDVAIFIDKGASDRRLNLKDFNKWIKSDRQETKINIGKDYDFYYTKKIRIPVNKNNITDLHRDSVLDFLDIELKTSQLEKKDIMILDLIEQNNWERPIYFAITIGSSGRSFLYLNDFFRLDGMVYKLMPKNYTNESSEMGGIDSSILYPILMKDYKWGNLNEDIYLDETNIRMTMNFRNNFSRLAQKLIKEKEYIKAKKVLDYCMTIMPGEKVALNYFVHPIIKSYYNINETESANKIIDLLHTTYTSELQYYLTFPENKIIGVSMEILRNLQFYNELVEIASKNNHPKALDMKQEFEQFYRSYLVL
ncbi:MAG: DUF2723 domain-containing protein [Flavobacteriales bacterium TMED191]|nr:MAG: DUF2723 domain-containing protein [Flavobacteriales bacterium TMED191]